MKVDSGTDRRVEVGVGLRRSSPNAGLRAHVGKRTRIARRIRRLGARVANRSPIPRRYGAAKTETRDVRSDTMQTMRPLAVLFAAVFAFACARTASPPIPSNARVGGAESLPPDSAQADLKPVEPSFPRLTAMTS